jgi:hypothetical protein
LRDTKKAGVGRKGRRESRGREGGRLRKTGAVAGKRIVDSRRGEKREGGALAGGAGGRTPRERGGVLSCSLSHSTQTGKQYCQQAKKEPLIKMKFTVKSEEKHAHQTTEHAYKRGL